MTGADQSLTKNFTIELEFTSIEELKGFASKYQTKIYDFKATKAKTKYLFHFVSILGPMNICKEEASFAEDL